MTIDDPSRSPEHGNPVERALEHIHHAEHGLEEAHQQERRAEHELTEAERELGEALHPRQTVIIVNARKRIVKGDEVSFEEIVQLAFPGSHDPNVAFSMTFRHAASEPHAGELGPGGHVTVKNGTIFNVTKTIRS
ncbi:multiubiquitin domain-containing protein [Bradyrhizobium sp. CB1717]|uniref:multiubiquitin domain-containing protein n=1 Tax=Bradyrhizobium sp. CB1717 TaxID=3039154 RepID=UPI0024B1A24C|nr:multiubiquitin domain-containing protein [Bradyrhizobium sp. CB1717]WFU24976.1 multiubiquitin domain-containing protein [Bradyrhizobium sp. CB1717]